MSLSSDDGDGNENVFKKTMSFVSETTTLHVQHAFLVHFFAVSARLQRFTFYVGSKQATERELVLENSTPSLRKKVSWINREED